MPRMTPEKRKVYQRDISHRTTNDLAMCAAVVIFDLVDGTLDGAAANELTDLIVAEAESRGK